MQRLILASLFPLPEQCIKDYLASAGREKWLIGLIQTRGQLGTPIDVFSSNSHSMFFSFFNPTRWGLEGKDRKKGERKGGQRVAEIGGGGQPPVRPCWPRSRLSGDDISKAIKGDDSRQAGSDWQGEQPPPLPPTRHLSPSFSPFPQLVMAIDFYFSPALLLTPENKRPLSTHKRQNSVRDIK